MKKYRGEDFRRSDDISIKQAVEKMLEVYRLRQKFDETSIVSAWPNIIGNAIANRTERIYIRDKKLYVYVESAVIKNELAMMRRQILGRVNEHVGYAMVEEFIIL